MTGLALACVLMFIEGTATPASIECGPSAVVSALAACEAGRAECETTGTVLETTYRPGPETCETETLSDGTVLTSCSRITYIDPTILD
jgi:hypothetical protein